MPRRAQRGFTLIELLIVIAVLGVITAIMIPNLLNALQRGKQKRTMGDIRTVGTALAAYEADQDKYPRLVAANRPLSDIRPNLEPTYVRLLPHADGWGRDMLYRSDAQGKEYTIISRGKDGNASGPASGPTVNFNDDIIFASGQFTTWPDGVQN